MDTATRPASPDLLHLVHSSLSDDKAIEPVTVDLTGKTSIADAMVVATGSSQRHLATMAQHLLERLKAAGLKGLSSEGTGQSDWILIDAGDVIVHLFKDELRRFYDLEKLWGAALPEDPRWSGSTPSRRAPRARSWSAAVRVTVAAIGRDRGGPARQLFDDYRKRSLWPLRLIELPPQSRLPLARRLAEEALRLLRSVPEGAVVVALDERGRQLDSLAFARRLGALAGPGTVRDRLSDRRPRRSRSRGARARELVVALGPMTWPHRLVRVLLAEQLYRAQAILAGHPYHRV